MEPSWSTPTAHYTYTPNLNSTAATASPSRPSDGTGGSDTAHHRHGEPVNDAPVAQDGSASGDEDAPINGASVATDVDNAAIADLCARH